ncbi:hypothetical protein AMS68_005273 [Peltaster fructicola]|uniref:Glycosyltransferase 2 n=1 Tax=Peltaster fructicola TaxID=286661 RepID=A0A6H0XYK2_9PEZI|nr:hypothetical protein AMS68_005273 [Peltaster fructicola]
MLLHSRVYTKDEELGKRDDDFKPRRQDSMTQQINPLRWRRRRLFGIVGAFVLVYLFIKIIPTNFDPVLERPVIRQQPPVLAKEPATTATHTSEVYNSTPTNAPPRADSDEAKILGNRYFDGMVKFYHLAETLTTVTASGKDPATNRNVLFAASSMKSLANLLPMACEMAAQEHNWVHVALMGRVDLSIEEIKRINSLDNDQCKAVLFHDARPDFCEYSTDMRHEAAVSGGLTHIKSHMAPHAIIVDNENAEDGTFARAIKRRAKELFIPFIEIPEGSYDSFKFITKLDYASLGHWHTPTIEIVMQTQQESVGSFIRLLRTLGAADYTGIRLPKLTINLATSIQPALRTFLNNFKWPPRYEPATRDVDSVTIRHQVQSQQPSSEQAALRVVESFYPASPDHHVLLLSPQIELSPQYMLYLHYTILRYKYAVTRTRGIGELLGIALDIPSFQVGEKPFVVPQGVAEDETLFLYGVPSSSSLLVFGDKWSVFHSYLTHRITATRTGKATKQEKLLSETEPAWTEYLLELVRARGWTVLYPSRSFATVHNELAQVPEEYIKENRAPEIGETNLEEPFLTEPNTPVLQDHKENQLSNPTTPLHDTLPQNGRLEDLVNLPYVSHMGQRVRWDDAQDAKNEYLPDFRHTIGGCSQSEAARPRILQADRADDLFCMPSVEMIFDTALEEQGRAHPLAT